MKVSENPYKLLKVDSEAPLEVVKAAYRALMKSNSMHPDLGGENHLAQEINLAYQILSDAEQRRKLDSKLKTSEQFVVEEKKSSEYFVVCLYCHAINRILHPQWVKQSQCSQCKTPFIITKKGVHKTTQGYTVKTTSDIPKPSEEKIDENLAQEFYDRKMYFRAISEYKYLVEKQPKEAYYSFKLGLCYYNMQYYRECLTHFRKAITKNNQFTAAYILAGKSLLQMVQHSEAMKYFIKAKNTTDEDYKVEANIGICQYKMGCFSQAVSVLLPIVKEHPTYEQTVYFLALAFYQMHDFRQAKEYLQLAQFHYSGNTKIAEMIGYCNRHLTSYAV